MVFNVKAKSFYLHLTSWNSEAHGSGFDRADEKDY
jgi:hypothetical protein